NVGERGVADESQKAVLGAHLATLVADEGDVDLGNPLEHLVRPDAVERREAGEERDHRVDAHADLRWKRWRYWSGDTPRRRVNVRRIVSEVPNPQRRAITSTVSAVVSSARRAASIRTSAT